MVDLALLQSVSYIAGALGVCVAAVYYVIMMRNIENTRKKDLINQRLQQNMTYLDAYWTALNMTDWSTLEEFYAKYTPTENPEKFLKLQYVLSHYNALGNLLVEGLVEADQIFSLYLPWSIMFLWEKFLPVMMRNRILYTGVVHNPGAYKGFEVLYEEAKRRYPKVDTTYPSDPEERRRFEHMIAEHLRANPVPH